MNGTGPRSCQADANLVRELGVRGRHEGGHLFVTYLHELKKILMTLKAPQDAVNAIAWIAINTLDPPL